MVQEFPPSPLLALILMPSPNRSSMLLASQFELEPASSSLITMVKSTVSFSWISNSMLSEVSPEAAEAIGARPRPAAAKRMTAMPAAKRRRMEWVLMGLPYG